MTPERSIIASSKDDVWQQINADLVAGNNLSDYHVSIELEGRTVQLNIISSPGGSFEGGYDTTTISSPLPAHSSFRFAIHPEDILNKIGKLFGLEDVAIGYPEFDKSVIIKTNDGQKLKNLFADESVRKVFENLSGFSFKTHDDHDKNGERLELFIQRGITDGPELQQIFNAFWHVLTSL